MEAALAVAAMVATLVVCLAGLAAIGAQIRCVDAAREAARLAARGDDGAVGIAVRSIGPSGAVLRMRRDGDFVVATVRATVPLLPGVEIGAVAVAAAEATG